MGTVFELPVLSRHFVVDDRGIGLRATWHLEQGIVNLSLWRGQVCVETFHLTPIEAGRLVGFLVSGLADAVQQPITASPLVAIVEPPAEQTSASNGVRAGIAESLAKLRCQVAAVMEDAASRIRP